MGNCHYVTQIKPTVHKNGAVIQVKSGEEDRFENQYRNWKDKDNTSLSKPEIEVHCPNVNESANKYRAPSKNLYLVLASGSKYGYRDELRAIYKRFSPYLEDALFYITDEYSEYIEKYEIKDGEFINQMVVPENGNLIEYYEEAYPKDEATLYHLFKREALDLFDSLPFDWQDTTQEIIKLTEKGLKIRPDDLEFFILKGNTQVYLKNYDQGIETLKKGQKIYEDKKGEGIERQFGRRLYSSLAYAYIQMEEFDKGIKLCELADKIYPTWNDDAPKEYMGFAYLNLQRFEEAIKVFDEIIKHNPKRNFLAFAFYNKACALTGLGRLEEASAFMTAAFALNPNKFPKALKEDKDVEALLNFKDFKKIMGPLHDLIPEDEL